MVLALWLPALLDVVDDKRVNVKEYQKVIGSLIRAQVYTRPDIAFALGKLSHFMSDPAEHL